MLVKRIKQAMSEFPEQAAIVSETYGGCKFRWMTDMAWCFLRYGARPIDYVRFEFHKKSGRERNRYLTIFRYFAFNKRMQKGIKYHLGGCKSEEYKLFKDYIHREWMIADAKTSPVDILNFIQKHQVVIAKPDHGEQGHGVLKINAGDQETFNQLVDNCKDTPYVVEECLVNHPLLDSINSSSLNTVRCYTFIDKQGKTHIMELMLRVGRKGSHVDNWGSGGIGYCFDIETGICSQYGLDKLNQPYSFHPDSNVLMLGFKLPNYEELKSYLYSLTKVIPEARYVGWDIAITPDGFDLVEMNCPGGHDFLQAFGRPWGEFMNKNW